MANTRRRRRASAVEEDRNLSNIAARKSKIQITFNVAVP
jgi:hypothetical protein